MIRALIVGLAVVGSSPAGVAVAQSAGAITQPGSSGAIDLPANGISPATGTMARVPSLGQPGSVGSTASPQNVVDRKERQLNPDGTFDPPAAVRLAPPFQ